MSDSKIVFPGLEDFQKSPQAFFERLEARYRSMTENGLELHFQRIKSALISAAGEEALLSSVSSEDLQLAILYQKRRTNPLTSTDIEKAKHAKKEAKAMALKPINPLDGFLV